MTLDTHQSNIRSIKQDDAGFYINNGLTIAARAGIEISPECPYQESLLIRSAFAKGWIKLVANVKDNELMWETLSQ